MRALPERRFAQRRRQAVRERATLKPRGGHLRVRHRRSEVVFRLDAHIHRPAEHCLEFCLNVGRIATAIAVLFVGTLVAWFGGYHNALLIFAVAYLLAALAGFFGKGRGGNGVTE